MKLKLSDEGVIRAIAELYCEIWREPPWLEDFWTTEGVIEDITREMQRPGASCLYVANGAGVAGFTWGYEVTHAELEAISGNAGLLTCVPKCTRLFYIDELAVGRDFRRRKLGEHLTAALLARISVKDGMCAVLLRTDQKAVAARALYLKLGFVELPVRDTAHPERTYWMK